ncbi:MAG: FAD-dependent oxidoreductase [Lachnospiraceae bacterium]|nr:FAD-dependent oxidoreductase [Lachnospiraceae bacterium]
MSRLTIVTKNQAQKTMEGLYQDLERRIVASPPGLCPVDMAASFLKLCHAQSCGKCVPCRIGLGQLERLLEDVLDGKGSLETINLIEELAEDIALSADCAIGWEAAKMVLKGVRGFREDYVEHVERGRCISGLKQAVPCVSLCPAGVDIPGYIALVGEKRYEDAVRLIRKDNPMVSVCGLICEHPCEARCRRNMLDQGVNIRGLKRYAAEHAGKVPAPKPADSTGKRVAVIGGGPGGISAAYYLSLMGHGVTIYEQRKNLGGMLRYGIPAYRLPREILDEEIKVLLSHGVKVETGVRIGEERTVEDLRKEYDAVYIAIGAHQDKKIGIPGEEAKGVLSAVEMLGRLGEGETLDFAGEDVIVIGGGNVAMDAARSAIRLGAAKVRVVYRRRVSDMTALPEEVEGAVAEGCQMAELLAPVRIEAGEDGKAEALWVQPQIIGQVKDGRPAPRKAAVGEERLACDRIIVAIGQGIETKAFEESGIPIRRGGIDALNWSGIQNIPGVFAGGDCVTGPATVIRAIAAGKVAAANIDEYLGFHHPIESGVEIPKIRLDDRAAWGRVNMKERNLVERKRDFALIEQGMSEEEALQEASRCLRCDHFGFGCFRGGRTERW